MRTGSDAVQAASVTEIMADARDLQSRHGRTMMAAALRRFRQAVAPSAHAPSLGAKGGCA